MWKSLKELKWELSDKHGRFLYINSLLRELPGRFGERLRGKYITGYFGSCGKDVTIYQGARFRGDAW